MKNLTSVIFFISSQPSVHLSNEELTASYPIVDITIS